MNSSLETFKPKLRPGRMIPHGATFTFEMHDSFEKITLPMIMADFILLCGGKYTIRDIAEKIYRKQGAVPFRAILETLYILHSRGFFENSSELHDQPWLIKQQLLRRRMYLEFRLKNVVIGPRFSPAIFYLTSLMITVVSLSCVILGWQDPMTIAAAPASISVLAFLGLFIANSGLLTGKHLLRAVQILILNGRVGDFSIRISPWAAYLRTSANLIETDNDRLFNWLFHCSQLLAPFSFVFAAQLIFRQDLTWLYSLTLFLTFWELSPFRRTEFFSLLRALMVPEQLDSLAFLGTGANPRHQRFIVVCSVFGVAWIVGCLKILEACIEGYGGSVEHAIAAGDFTERLGAVVFVSIWLGTVFFSVHSLVETAVAVLAGQFESIKMRIVRRLKTSPPVFSEQWVIETLRRLPLFAHLTDEGLQRLVTGSHLLKVEAKTPIIIEGEESRNLYVLFDGQVVIQKGEARSSILPVTIFGESALLDHGTRSANVISVEPCLLMKIPVATLRQVARESHVIGEIDSFMTAIMVDQFFASAPLFRKLPREGIDYLSSRGVLEFTSPDQVIFKQGDAGEYFYMLIRGQVRVEVNGVAVKRIAQGGFFGEISLIANIPRTASIVSDEPSVLFKISADAFWETLVQHIEMAVFIEKVSEQRLREDIQMMRKVG